MLLENVLEFVRFLQAALGDQFPRLLPQGAVRFLQVTAHLHQRLFLAAKLHRERAAQFLILLRKFGFLGFQRNIFRPEQFDMVFHVAVKNINSASGGNCARNGWAT